MKMFLAISAVVTVFAAVSAQGAEVSGKELFERHCARCHPDGGNIIVPDKTLRKKDLDRRGITDAKKVMAAMQNGIDQKMPVFPTNVIPKKDAKAIAEYILETFK